MNFHLLNRFLNLGPNRRVLTCLGKSQLARRWCHHLSRSGAAFETFAEAAAASARFHPGRKEHGNQDLMASNFQTSAQLRTSDYPAAFWIQKIIVNEPSLSVFDFGGGWGQTLVAIAPLLAPHCPDKWTVFDLPDVIKEADARAPAGEFPARLSYTSELADGRNAGLVLAAGSLHYWHEPIAAFFQGLGGKPRHFIVNRSPMRSEGEPYFTVQSGDGWAVPCLVRSFPAFTEEMSAEGYRLVDRWTLPEKSLSRPWLPEFSCPYQGAYFSRMT